jgi:hypothetical protein
MRAIVVGTIVSACALVAAACGSRQSDLPVSAVPDIHADVRGESSATCVLAFSNAGHTLVYDVAAPVVVPDVALPTMTMRDPLGQCMLDSTSESVDASPRENAPPILVERTGACLVAFGARDPFFAALEYDTQRCPESAALTVACGDVTLYDVTHHALCTVGM